MNAKKWMAYSVSVGAVSFMLAILTITMGSYAPMGGPGIPGIGFFVFGALTLLCSAVFLITVGVFFFQNLTARDHG